MKKFLVLYRSSMSAKDQMMQATPEQGKASMDAWLAWGKKAGAAQVDPGAPLDDSALATGTAGQGHIGGYAIVQAESLHAAKELFEGHPHHNAPNASIDLLEMLSMPGI